jgi:hypothetical protein
MAPTAMGILFLDLTRYLLFSGSAAQGGRRKVGG